MCNLLNSSMLGCLCFSSACVVTGNWPSLSTPNTMTTYTRTYHQIWRWSRLKSQTTVSIECALYMAGVEKTLLFWGLWWAAYEMGLSCQGKQKGEKVPFLCCRRPSLTAACPSPNVTVSFHSLKSCPGQMLRLDFSFILFALKSTWNLGSLLPPEDGGLPIQ